MLKHNNQIIHIGSKSLYEFLSKFNAPIILYGFGEEGHYIYNSLQKHKIKLHAIGDGDINKQNTIIDEHRIISMADICNNMPKNSLIWVSIANEKIATSVINQLSVANFENIINIHLKDPVSLYNFSNFKKDLKALIIGTNDLAIRITKHLIANQIEIIGYSDNEFLDTTFNGFPVKSLDTFLSNYSNINIIICKDSEYKFILPKLQNYSLLGNVYRGIISGIGEFKIHKYQFENYFISQALNELISCVNMIYHTQKDKKTQNLFKLLVTTSLSNFKKNYPQIKNSLSNEDFCLLYDITKNNYISNTLVFSNITNNLIEFIKFLFALKQISINENKQFNLEIANNVYKITIIQ